MITFRQHKDAAARLASAKKLVQILLDADDLYPSHRREFIRLALWKVSEAEGGKYRTRYRSLKSRRKGAHLQHDHVVERAKLADELISHPERAVEILDTVVGCVVTEGEHRRLTEVSRRQPGLSGWARYAAAGIVVIDTKTGDHLSFPSQADQNAY
jgi:hypothetical protein